MKDAAAYAGVFSDFKLVKTRSMAQFIIEIPIEQADAALAAMGGVPQAGREKPVAIARINTQPPSHAPEKPVSGQNGNGAGKRRWEDLSRAQRAGIMCGEGAFIRFLEECYPHAINHSDTAQAVRHICGVDSRRDLDTNEQAGSTFDRVAGEYKAWMHAA
jgi:hypothetical protein